MPNSLAGKIFTIYSIIFCGVLLLLMHPLFEYSELTIGAVMVVSTVIIVLSIIATIKLFRKTNDERIIMLIIFVIYIVSMVGTIIYMSIQTSFFQGMSLYMFFIIPVLSGLLYLDRS